MQSPDHASAPNASDGRCQPTNRTPVANVALMQPPAIARNGRQRTARPQAQRKRSNNGRVSARVCVSLKATFKHGVIGYQHMPWEHVFKDLRASNAATAMTPTMVQRRITAIASVAIAPRKSVRFLTSLRRSESNVITFHPQRLAAKERVIVELMSPGRAYEGEIINDQQNGANHRSKQKTTFNDFAAIIHTDGIRLRLDAFGCGQPQSACFCCAAAIITGALVKSIPSKSLQKISSTF